MFYFYFTAEFRGPLQVLGDLKVKDNRNNFGADLLCNISNMWRRITHLCSDWFLLD